jgi:hypothetical protein
MSSRGPFRKWLVLSAAWITCIGLIGYVAVFLEVPRRFHYVYQVRGDVESWQEGRSPDRAPIYDVMRSPSQEELSPEFLPIGETTAVVANEWNKHVDEGPILEFNFLDGTTLRLSSLLTEKDRDYLVAAFWNERWSRWSRWATVATPWIVAALVPPLLLLGILWLFRRSRHRKA